MAENHFLGSKEGRKDYEEDKGDGRSCGWYVSYECSEWLLLFGRL